MVNVNVLGNIGIEVLIAETTLNAIDRPYKGTCRPRLHGRRVSQTSNQQEAKSNQHAELSLLLVSCSLLA
jgi:hypothetical protein